MGKIKEVKIIATKIRKKKKRLEKEEKENDAMWRHDKENVRIGEVGGRKMKKRKWRTGKK